MSDNSTTSEAGKTGPTPGIWSTGAIGSIKRHKIFSEDGCLVADCDKLDAPIPERASNARLIAAAPDLLAACKDAQSELTIGEPDIRRLRDVIGAAIAKAEGR